jgi:hypothetical protein
MNKSLWITRFSVYFIHRCQCPHVIKKREGVRGGATHIHKRKLSSEPHVKKGYKLGNHHFYNPGITMDP